MKKSFSSGKLFHLGLLSILFFSLLIRIVPLSGNHFYFTMDQGRDAVFARDILHGNFPLVGPVTDVKGLYHGALWYYLVAFTFLFSGGHPFGPIAMLILLNTFIIGAAALVLKDKIGPLAALLTTLILAIFLPFYETSRYAFNPFLAAGLGMIFVYFLSKSFSNKKYFLLACIITGFVFHSEILAFIPFSAVLFFFGIILFARRKAGANFLFLCLCVTALFLLPHFIYEVKTDFSQLSSLLNHLKSNESSLVLVFSKQMLVSFQKFIDISGSTVSPQFPNLGFLLFLLIFLAALIKRKKIDVIILVCLSLYVTSLLWFGLAREIKPWFTVYLPPLMLIFLVLLLKQFSGKLLIFLLSMLFISQSLFSIPRITSYYREEKDPGLLQNQLRSIDWIYEKARGKGFSVYTYVPSVYDFHYQYLFFWYGLGKYHYLPCEYSTYPGIDASLYVPHSVKYQDNQKNCGDRRFLIMEPAIDWGLQKIWYEGAGKNTSFVSGEKVKNISVEERKL